MSGYDNDPRVRRSTPGPTDGLHLAVLAADGVDIHPVVHSGTGRPEDDLRLWFVAAAADSSYLVAERESGMFEAFGPDDELLISGGDFDAVVHALIGPPQ